METIEVIIQGGGEHARVVLDSLLSKSVKVLALFDPKYSGDLMGVPQRGIYDPLFAPAARAVVAIGNNSTRKQVVGQTGHAFFNVVDRSAVVSSRAQMGTGNMVLQGAILQAFVRLGNHVIVNTGAKVDHDCVVEDYAHIAPGATLCGTVWVGEGAMIGAGAVILPGKKIGAWSVVGAGAVVTRDVPANEVVVGNPARALYTQKG